MTEGPEMLDVARILAPNPSVYTLEGTNTWIIGAGSGEALVIDPGPDDSGHLAEVERAAGPIGTILVTHDHEDHAPGAPTLARQSGAQLWAARIPEAQKLADGQEFTAAGITVTAIYSPGHSSDHFVFYVRSHGALFTGDAVVGRGTSFIDPPDGDLKLYMDSLRRMRQLEPRVIYPGHGPVVLEAVGKLDEYLRHRQDREDQVVGALTAGSRSVADLVADLYRDYPKEVHELAARSVLSHLLKLKDESRAAVKPAADPETGEWSLTPSATGS